MFDDLFTREQLAAYLQIPVDDIPVETYELYRDLIGTEILNVIGQRCWDAADITRFLPIALEIAKRLWLNPEGKRSVQRSVDDYSETDTYGSETITFGFVGDEERRLRRAAGCSNAFTIIPGATP